MTSPQAYHLCFVVSDLDATASELGTVLGVEWAPIQDRTLTTESVEGSQEVTMRVTFSRPESGPCLIELIEGPKGSVWYPGDGVKWAFHHMGYWSEDLASDSARVRDAGYPVEATMSGPEDLNLFAYHRLEHGPRVELVDIARKPLWEAWVGGADRSTIAPSGNS